MQAEFGDYDAVRSALRGHDAVLMVSAAETPDRVERQRRFLDAAADAGISHLVYISFSGAASNATFTLARDHWATEEYIRASGLAFTFLRDNLYADFLAVLLDPARGWFEAKRPPSDTWHEVGRASEDAHELRRDRQHGNAVLGEGELVAQLHYAAGKVTLQPVPHDPGVGARRFHAEERPREGVLATRLGQPPTDLVGANPFLILVVDNGVGREGP